MDSKNYSFYMLIIIVFGIGIYFFRNPSKFLSIVDLVLQRPLFNLMIFFSFIFMVFIIYTYTSTVNSNTHYWSGKALNLSIIIFIALIGTYLVTNYISTANLSQRGWTGVISEILLYLPCKIQELIVWFLGEVKNTPQSVFLLLAIEILVLVWVFRYKSSTKWFSLGKQQVFPIYDTSTYLVEKTPITSYANLSKITGTSNQTVPMNFGISFWFYINDNTQNKETELPVFCYGGGESVEVGGCDSSSPYAMKNIHPAVTFLPTHSYSDNRNAENIWRGAGLEWNIGQIKLYFSNCSETTDSDNTMLVDIPLQRWNMMTVNYTSQQADVFINGELVGNHTFTKPPIYSLGDSITVGGKGLQGAIKDIQYSVTPFEKQKINTMYNNTMFMSKLLPTFVTR